MVFFDREEMDAYESFEAAEACIGRFLERDLESLRDELDRFRYGEERGIKITEMKAEDRLVYNMAAAYCG